MYVYIYAKRDNFSTVLSSDNGKYVSKYLFFITFQIFKYFEEL